MFSTSRPRSIPGLLLRALAVSRPRGPKRWRPRRAHAVVALAIVSASMLAVCGLEEGERASTVLEEPLATANPAPPATVELRLEIAPYVAGRWLVLSASDRGFGRLFLVDDEGHALRTVGQSAGLGRSGEVHALTRAGLTIGLLGIGTLTLKDMENLSDSDDRLVIRTGGQGSELRLLRLPRSGTAALWLQGAQGQQSVEMVDFERHRTTIARGRSLPELSATFIDGQVWTATLVATERGPSIEVHRATVGSPAVRACAVDGEGRLGLVHARSEEAERAGLGPSLVVLDEELCFHPAPIGRRRPVCSRRHQVIDQLAVADDGPGFVIAGYERSGQFFFERRDRDGRLLGAPTTWRGDPPGRLRVVARGDATTEYRVVWDRKARGYWAAMGPQGELREVVELDFAFDGEW